MKQHWRWRFREKIMRDDHALSEVIGTILTVSVVLTGASAIMLWGGPYMEELESKAVGEEAHNKLSQAIENIEDITHETAGSRRTFQMDVKRGLFDIENVGDRFVFSYSMIDGYDFTVAGLDDNNKTFSIDVSEGSSLSGVEVFWFPDDPIITFDAM